MLRRLTGALLAVGLLALPTTASRAQAEPVPGRTLDWHACAAHDLAAQDLQCATLAVPLDPAHPTGEQVRLALTRRLHYDAPYRGVMLVNPGGPGASGLAMATMGDYVPEGVGATYDWIGFDPRGVGASTPTLSCSRSWSGPDRPSYVPRTAQLTRYWTTASRAYAASCARTALQRNLLRHLTTLDTVRDMEAIREALGVPRLGFYGFSYGTYLGQLYATRHPDRVGRFVLDGVVDPRRVWYAANLDQERAFDANIATWFQWLAAHPGSFHLGTSGTAIRRGYYRELARLERHPAAAGRLGPDELADVLLDAGYYTYDWAGLGYAYADLVRHGRGADMWDRYRESTAGADNEFAVYNGVQCSDVAWPDWARTRADAWTVHRRTPFMAWGNTWYNAPCLSWPAPTHTRLGVSGRAVHTPILLVNETRDAATPYTGALEVRRRFPTASLVAGVGGTSHASSLSGVTCVDTTVATYLRTGTVPARHAGSSADRSCPRLLPMSPAGYYGRRVAGTSGGLPPALRQVLRTAQTTGR